MKALIFLSKGYEEVEALTVVDYFRRAGIPIDMVATEGDKQTVGAHGISILADKLLEEIAGEPEGLAEYDLLVTPGGMEGTRTLAENPLVIRLLQEQFTREDGYIASICASPLVLARAGIAQKIQGTVYPGMEGQADFKEYLSKPLVVYDREHKVITSQGPATAVYFALQLVAILKGEEAKTSLAADLLLPQVEEFVRG